MTKSEKSQVIEDLSTKLSSNNVVYLADVSEMTVEKSNKLRSLCFKRNVSLQVVKNTLLKKAMEKVEDKNYEELYDVLKGNTSVMFAEVSNVPAKLIKEFRKKEDKPLLKAAWIDSTVFLGENQLDTLATLKSKEELIGDIIGLLQSPVKTVMSQLNSGGNKLAGIVQTLSERAE